MDSPVYHVLLEGRKVGPYDRRTIVGMRIKNTLTSDHVLITSDGVQLTVADIVRKRDDDFQANRTGSYSLVQATYPASLVEADAGSAVPDFKGEMEARVQRDVLRLSGRFRKGMAWKEDRVKIPLDTIAHARVRGSVVDLWMRAEGGGLKRMSLELFTPETAGEFVDWLPQATPWPGGDAAPTSPRTAGAAVPLTWAAVVGTVLVIGGVALWLLLRRA